MKNMKKLIAAAFLLVMVLSMTACGKDLSGSPYVGSWTGTEAEYSGMTLSVEDFFDGFSLDLDAKGKASVTIDGETKKGKWDETDNGIILDNEMELVADGDRLSYELDGVTIYFEKQ